MQLWRSWRLILWFSAYVSNSQLLVAACQEVDIYLLIYPRFYFFFSCYVDCCLKFNQFVNVITSKSSLVSTSSSSLSLPSLLYLDRKNLFNFSSFSLNCRHFHLLSWFRLESSATSCYNWVFLPLIDNTSWWLVNFSQPGLPRS